MDPISCVNSRTHKWDYLGPPGLTAGPPILARGRGALPGALLALPTNFAVAGVFEDDAALG